MVQFHSDEIEKVKMILVHPKKKNDFTNIVIMILDFSLLVLPVKLMPLISIASILVSILITTWDAIQKMEIYFWYTKL